MGMHLDLCEFVTDDVMEVIGDAVPLIGDQGGAFGLELLHFFESFAALYQDESEDAAQRGRDGEKD